MKKRNYFAPEMELMEVMLEQGIAASPIIDDNFEDLEDGWEL